MIHNIKERFVQKNKGEKIMNCEKCNKSINCTVTQCVYHSGSENYCTLDKIAVGTHESNPTMPECTDCNSFKCK